jgi:hypothetical protein
MEVREDDGRRVGVCFERGDDGKIVLQMVRHHDPHFGGSPEYLRAVRYDVVPSGWSDPGVQTAWDRYRYETLSRGEWCLVPTDLLPADYVSD